MHRRGSVSQTRGAGRGAGTRQGAGTYNRDVSAQAEDRDEQRVDIEDLLVYDGDGLVPCIVQDWSTGEVLTLAYMNEQALARTRDTGELHLWSRSREQQWHKGETSGNVQTVREL